MTARHLIGGLLAGSLVAAGCNTKLPVASKRVASAPPGVASSVTTLTGKVKLISQTKDLVSQTKDVTGNDIVSNNGSSIISNNGGTLISDNGGGLISQTKDYRLAAVAPDQPREFLLADAVLTVDTLDGKPVLDASGKPVTATTDRQGGYTLKAALPARNLLLHVKLWNGGTLSAMLPKPGPTSSQAVDTGTSIGAAYVLGKYVKGSQATFDKLPAAEAEKLHADLSGAQGLLTVVPSYADASLLGLGDTLRGKAPAVDATLKEIQALLLGQPALGNGMLATKVALQAPRGLQVAPNGELYFGEPEFGRIREVDPDGTITTLMDVQRGRIPQNFPQLSDAVLAPDGGFYVANSLYVYRVTADGTVTTLAGNGLPGDPTLPVAALATPISPNRLALAPDGTLYIGEYALTGSSRLLKLGADGQLQAAITSGGWTTPGIVTGVGLGPDGTVYAVHRETGGGLSSQLYACKGGVATPLGDPVTAASGLAVGPDGTVYVSQALPPAVIAVTPDGKSQALPDPQALLKQPGALAFGPDGQLYVADDVSKLIYALAPGGSWTLRAGTSAVDVAAGNVREIAFSLPDGAAFDAQDNLIIAENGSARLERYDGKALTTIAGSLKGDAGDGGPATQALIGQPTGVAIGKGTIYFGDEVDAKLRAIGPDGVLHVLAGVHDKARGKTIAPGERRDPATVELHAVGLAVGPDGLLYFSTREGQVCRLAADGMVEVVAGAATPDSDNNQTNIKLIQSAPTDDGGPAASTFFIQPSGIAFDAKGDLYIADTLGMRIRKVVDPMGPAPTIETFAGSSPVALFQEAPPTQDGVKAHDAALVAPAGLAFDAAGNMYVGELGTVALWLFANLGGAGGDELRASLPKIYARVRKIAPDGTMTTVCGPGTPIFPDPKAEDGLMLPSGIAVAKDGRLAIVDNGANLVRILPAGSY